MSIFLYALDISTLPGRHLYADFDSLEYPFGTAKNRAELRQVRLGEIDGPRPPRWWLVAFGEIVSTLAGKERLDILHSHPEAFLSALEECRGGFELVPIARARVATRRLLRMAGGK